MVLAKGLWSKLLHLNTLMFASKTEEFLSLSSLAGLVIVRTWMSNSIAQLNGQSLTLMLNQDSSGFVKLIGWALVQGFGQALMAPTLSHLEATMSLVWRKRLTNHILSKYMSGQVINIHNLILCRRSYFHIRSHTCCRLSISSKKQCQILKISDKSIKY